MSLRRAVGPVAFLLALIGASCSTRRAPALVPDAGQPGAGLYRASLESADGRRERFRVLLLARAPDRLHAELIGPLGATQVVVDGGGGALSVALVRKKVAFVGPATSDVLGRLLGLPLSLEQLVGGLLVGRVEGLDVRRTGEPAGLLPRRLEVRTAQGRLALELRDRRTPGPGSADLGTGRPPPGMERRPLDALRLDDEPELDVAEPVP